MLIVPEFSMHPQIGTVSNRIAQCGLTAACHGPVVIQFPHRLPLGHMNS
jgi:hypothetical protein